MVERRPEEATLSQAEMALMAAFEARSGDASPGSVQAPLSDDQTAELDDYMALHGRMEEVELAPLSPGIRGLILSAAAEQDQAEANRSRGLLTLLGALLRPGPLVAMGTLAALAVAVSVRMDNKTLQAPAASKPEMIALGTDKDEDPDSDLGRVAEEPEVAETTAAKAGAAPRPSHLIPGRYEPMDPKAARAAREAAAALAAEAAADRNAALGPEPAHDDLDVHDKEMPSSDELKRLLGRAGKQERLARKPKPTATKAAKAQAFAVPPPAQPARNFAPDDDGRELDSMLADNEGAAGGGNRKAKADERLDTARYAKKRAKSKPTGQSERQRAPSSVAQAADAPAPPSAAPRAQRSAPRAAGEADKDDSVDNLQVLKQRISRIARAGNIDKNEARYVKLLEILRDRARRSGDKGIERWANKQLAEQRLKATRRAEAERKRVSSKQATKARAKAGTAKAPPPVDKAISKD